MKKSIIIIATISITITTVLLANAYLTDIDNELLTDYNYTEEDLFELFV
ncbi:MULTISPECIES: hypothetical protein [Streptococcus]|uniref:Uncharacterized protein n=1 Tax=Streptococcus anginosus DORA_7 TaxID=1403946 RepID=W1TSK8_STRAP|nr:MULTISPECIES: hypothetical protein [Streptococcus]ETI84476.1 MAG: hypothetical protein Q615_SPAC00127G0120 [Streptococcus anginosus DORA_7]MCW0999640.1 hypothetical protein [Streptococcus anginosus]MCW1005850.1 hypothetical protein [Streptococcus anginosus]MCW1013167.1 hypothetical protein [Streptococcus anginosus]MDB8648106.1 hypothetical protein [Streptococcus anginosus]